MSNTPSAWGSPWARFTSSSPPEPRPRAPSPKKTMPGAPTSRQVTGAWAHLVPSVQCQPQRLGHRAQAPHGRMGSLYPNPSWAQEGRWRSHLWSLCVGNVLLQGHMSHLAPSVCHGEEQQGSASPVPGGAQGPCPAAEGAAARQKCPVGPRGEGT